VLEATGTESVRRFLDEHVLRGGEWRVTDASRRSVRLEPPDDYWAVYRILVSRNHTNIRAGDPGASLENGAQRELRLVARACFQSDRWARYREHLRNTFGGLVCDPISGLGAPVLFDDTQHAFWFYPADPNLLGLNQCADSGSVRRLFRQRKRDVLSHRAGIRDVEVTRLRYVPEIAAVLRYDIETSAPATRTTIYGKLQHSDRGAQSATLMRELATLSDRSEGRLRVPRPLGYWADLGMLLQSAVAGEPVSGDRTAPEFLAAAEAAAQALAVIHDSDIRATAVLHVEEELSRLDRLLDQFILVHPPAHFMLRELLGRIRRRLGKTDGEDRVPTHGDLKYDQLIHRDGCFTLIDFDYFGMAETSHDLGKFCAHLVPSKPRGWEDSYAAEQARNVFLGTYRTARPDASLQRFSAYEAIHLANRAMTLMWSQVGGWEAAAESMLALAGERLTDPSI
jgi:aminoglycoside phosphotransferase